MPLFASLTLVKETALTRGCFSKISVTDFVYRKRTPSYRPTNSFIPQMQNTALVFQGETALRLCYGAPRYSEDYARRQKLFLTNEQIGK